MSELYMLDDLYEISSFYDVIITIDNTTVCLKNIKYRENSNNAHRRYMNYTFSKS